MNTQALSLRSFFTAVLISMFLTACSVEKKDASESAEPNSDNPVVNLDNDPPMIMNPENIILPPADYFEAEPQVIVPKPKTPLTKQQLLAGTLDAHNRVRAKHGLQPLKWSNKLAAYSQQWANHLGTGNSCKMYHRSGPTPYGENLYISSAVVWSDGKNEISRERNQVNIRNVVKV